MPDRDLTLKITEIFYSLQGESNTVGLPTVFVRLTGCPLRCTYCDTAYAFSGGQRLSLAVILEQVAAFQVDYVTVTGGEPLAQPACLLLLKALCDQGYRVSVETSGALSVKAVDTRVVKVLDFKTPSSGECHRNLYQNTQYLTRDDQIKFVIGDREDYMWAKNLIVEHRLNGIAQLLFSPEHGVMSNTHLADWIVADRLPVRFQIQLHKYIWPDEPGR